MQHVGVVPEHAQWCCWQHVGVLETVYRLIMTQWHVKRYWSPLQCLSYPQSMLKQMLKPVKRGLWLILNSQMECQVMQINLGGAFHQSTWTVEAHPLVSTSYSVTHDQSLYCHLSASSCLWNLHFLIMVRVGQFRVVGL